MLWLRWTSYRLSLLHKCSVLWLCDNQPGLCFDKGYQLFSGLVPQSLQVWVESVDPASNPARVLSSSVFLTISLRNCNLKPFVFLTFIPDMLSRCLLDSHWVLASLGGIGGTKFEAAGLRAERRAVHRGCRAFCTSPQIDGEAL